MPIDWTTWKNDVKSFFDSKSAVTEDFAAQYIALQYTNAVLQGGDSIAGNVVIVQPAMTRALKDEILGAFEDAKNLTEINLVPLLFGSKISKGLINFWKGAQLGVLIPPPGSILIVPPNQVAVPGVVMPRLEVGHEMDFTEILAAFFQQHLQKLSGTTIALIPAAPSPIPTPFPWTGYV
jgi:hypothetical protein